MIALWLVSGGVVGWFARFLFVQSNQYRMLKRLTAYHREQERLTK